MQSALHELERDLELLHQGAYFGDLKAAARRAAVLLTPPEQISTTESASRFRLLRNAEHGERLWSPTLTPYINGIQDAFDDPKVPMIAVVGPGRSGKTTSFENHLHKRLKFGPLTDVIFYAPRSVLEEYLDDTVAPLFDLHPDIKAKVGSGKSDNNKDSKKVAGKFIRWLSAEPGKIASKQAPLIGADEIDLMNKKLRSNIVQQIRIRQRAFGSLAKGFVSSHPDAGWKDGIAAIWLESNRGMWWWPCPECGDWSTPMPLGEHVSRLHIEMPENLRGQARLDYVKERAGLACPHCGSIIDHKHREAMNAAGKWVFQGQTIDPATGQVTGEPNSAEVWGYWIHGTMTPFVSWGQLAVEYVAALVYFEDTQKSDRLKEVMSKALGEVYQGANGAQDFTKLKQRAAQADDELAQNVSMGFVPRWARYLTAAVDVGGNKFDVLVLAWGADGECKVVDRYTINSVKGRKISPPQRQSDWLVLETEVLIRFYPIAGRPGWVMPVASTAIDTGGAPGTTHKAREFARQMKLTGKPCAGINAYRIRLVKGSSNKNAVEIANGREINRDDKSRPIVPSVTEYTIGVHKLKDLIVDRLAIDSPGAGFIHLPRDMEEGHIKELTTETKVNGVYVRAGGDHTANETFDLMVYNEVARQLLQPDRPGINWNNPPVWARPQQAPAAKPVVQAAAPVLTPEQQKAQRRQELLQRIAR